MKTAAKTNICTCAVIVALLLLIPHQARAHHFMDGTLPQTLVQGFLSGLGHPLIGLDHAAFIIAAGFFIAIVTGGLWGIAALIIGSLIGASMHLMGIGLPGGEVGVALSVILIGGLLMARRQITLSWLVSGLALTGFLHGHAYAESIFGAEATPLVAYLIGFSLIQLGIAITAWWFHRRLIVTRETWAPPVAAGLGAVVSTIGTTYLVINLLN